jgi:hypothetical protein
MKKQELIHLHGLLAEVHTHYEQVSGTEITASKYRTMGVQPTSIHKSKTDHKAAVFALADGMRTEMDADQDERAVSATAD